MIFIEKNKKNKHYQAFFNSDVGKELLLELKKYCKIDIDSSALFYNGSVDPLMMAVYNGRREVYQYILKLLEDKKS